MTVKFTSNQLFVFKNVKLFLSFTELFDRIIITSYLDKQLFVTVEVDSTDKVFILLNKYYYLGNLFVWVEAVTDFEVFSSCFALLTIWKDEFEWKAIVPQNLSNSWISEFLQTLFGECLLAWKTNCTFHKLSYTDSNYLFT